ncbi:MAG: hypothetical protein A2289_23925 [Deltaproteobacteria bacterium RIFOXYA12_FULL_58_15]|nr:MAG: hypothetical protein A2289_23925 [Deltaproteobacteria bacterium RIFOXYA12_FULL_58_15]
MSHGKFQKLIDSEDRLLPSPAFDRPGGDGAETVRFAGGPKTASRLGGLPARLGGLSADFWRCQVSCLLMCGLGDSLFDCRITGAKRVGGIGGFGRGALLLLPQLLAEPFANQIVDDRLTDGLENIKQSFAGSRDGGEHWHLASIVDAVHLCELKCVAQIPFIELHDHRYAIEIKA